VIAKLLGADPKRKNEAVLHTPLYDHLGIDLNKQGDNIYNGAVDNATGCGILLGAGACMVRGKNGAGALDSVRFGNRRGARASRLGVSGETFARTASENFAGSELRRLGPHC
jgi:hypothetical protein